MVKIGDSYVSEAMITSIRTQETKSGGYYMFVYTVNGEEYKESFGFQNDRDLRVKEIIRCIDRYNEHLDMTAAIMSLKTEIQIFKNSLGYPSEVPVASRESIYDEEPIDNLGLTDRSYRAIKRRFPEIKTIGDIRHLGWNGIRRLKGIGAVRLQDIKDKYEAYTGFIL